MTQSDRVFNHELAVSPVVGVMLMLVVVIIIAAVASQYAGGLISTGSNKKAPTLDMDVKIVNTGNWHESGFFATVTGVSGPIPTKDIKIVTSRKVTLQDHSHTVMLKQTEVLPGKTNINVIHNVEADLSDNVGDGYHVAPFGTGPGVNTSEKSSGSQQWKFSLSEQQFGNYTLLPGTVMVAAPAGALDDNNLGLNGASGNRGYGIVSALVPGSYVVDVPSTLLWLSESQYQETGDPVTAEDTGIPFYVTSNNEFGEPCIHDSADTDRFPDYFDGTSACRANAVQAMSDEKGHWVGREESSGSRYNYNSCNNACIDPTRAVLGSDWYTIRWGDTVNVKVIHIPTGKVIFNKDVTVMEGSQG